jgi:single-stranded DNA-binding protein
VNAFSLFAVGNLGRDPQVLLDGRVRLVLIGTDYHDADREVVVSIPFIADGEIGQQLAQDARKGDQLIVQGFIRTGRLDEPDYVFHVRGFRFGAPGKGAR